LRPKAKRERERGRIREGWKERETLWGGGREMRYFISGEEKELRIARRFAGSARSTLC
jgi:hypothetical protein